MFADLIPPIDKKADILLLIGKEAMPPNHVLDQRLGNPDEPFAQRLKLGGVIIGECCLDDMHVPQQINTMKTQKIDIHQ